jgi:hypothetical protein
MSRDLNPAEIAAMANALYAAQEREKLLCAELDTLRLIVTEKFARDIEVAVKPEDAADVAKWAQNPDAVRELLKHTPQVVASPAFEEPEYLCAGCGAADPASHHVVSWSPQGTTFCRVFTAWAALDDPRAAEAIGAAFDRARPLVVDVGGGFGLRMRTPEEMGLTAEQVEALNRPIDRSVWLDDGSTADPAADYRRAVEHLSGTYRLASESQQAARERQNEWIDRMPYPMRGLETYGDASLPRPDSLLAFASWAAAVNATRDVSDARGMEAVEAEAWVERLARMT